MDGVFFTVGCGRDLALPVLAHQIYGTMRPNAPTMPGSAPPLVLAVLVLYERHPSLSTSFVSLQNAYRKHPELDDLQVLIYDNSRSQHAIEDPRVYYFHNPNNGGLQ